MATYKIELRYNPSNKYTVVADTWTVADPFIRFEKREGGNFKAVAIFNTVDVLSVIKET